MLRKEERIRWSLAGIDRVLNRPFLDIKGNVVSSYQVSLRGHADQDEVVTHPDLFTF